MFDPGDGTSMSEFVDQRSLVTWSHTRHTDQQASCFSALFEAQAAQRPESIAVIYGQQHLTYQELNRRANQLAHYLRRLGVGPDVRVGLCVERSLDLAVGVLGILKAGGAYVPLDPTYPPARLQLMLQDAQTAVLVTQRRLVEMLSQGEAAGHARRICLDADASIIAQQPASDLASGVLPDHLAYVIYTSGSTGRPKGVLVTHRGIASLSQTQIRSFAVTPDARILQFASLSFDAAVWEMCMAWLSGAALVIAPTDALLPGPALIDTLRDYAITTVTLPPAVLTVLPDAALPALRTIIVAGEACPGAVVARWAVGRQLFNAYGPTETTICATVSDALSGSTAPPIGRALPNMCVYLLDARMQPVPDGAPGELCVGGIGLARGYHRRPDLTAERFVPDPFSQIGGARLYRTGDLARCLPDGNIEYLGRIDQQVKIRGFRVELGEIEAALRQHPAVRDAVVLAREDGNGDKRLVAYVVREQANKEPETRNSALTTRNADLRAYLANYLPDYMVPRAFIFLDALPLNANGKLDRSALPAPDSMRPDLDTAFVPPRTPTEALLAEIWAQVLGLDRVGVDDHFLLLGGHSLAATQVVARIRDRLAVDLPLPTLFTLPTVAELAVALDAARDVGSMQTEAIPLAPRDGLLPLTFAQEQVWLLQQLTPTNQSYSAQSTLRFRGALDVAVLRQSLNALVARHEILRTTFPEIGGHPVQRIGDPWHVALPLVDLSSSPEAEREAIVRQVIDAEFYAPFDVERLPLVRWTLVRLGPDEHLLIHVEHHFVHDGWSYAVFLRELFQLYRAGVTGQPAALPPLPLQFADYAVWQRQWLLSAEAERQRAYWRRILAGASPVLELPTDYPRPAMQRFQGTSARIELPPALCTAARATAQAEGVTLYMLLLTAFVTLMRRYSGQTDILVGSGVANRRTRETETLIGMIVNMVVLRANLPGNPTARELLRHVRDVALEAYAHQDLPFEQVVEAVAPQRTLRYNPIFQVAFNFHDSPLPELELPGLTVEVNEALSNGSAKFDLNIVAIPRAEQHLGQRERAADDGITLVWEYNTDLFSAATIERMVTHFQALIGQIAANPEQRIGNLPLLSEAERQQIVVEWNATATPYPHDRCIHQLFEEQAARTPDALAVVCGDQRLSYRELDQRANQLAHHLRVLGVGGRSQRETLVSVYLERSIELMVAILGVLKAGGAYVPLDPAYPTSRLAFMLAETQAPVLLTQHQLLDSLPTSQAQVICLDTAWEQIAGQPATALPSSTAAHNLAYVMYTSGSTGQPKGIGVMHQSVVRLVKQTNYVRLSPEDVFLQLAPMAFDAATFEIWGSLLNGAQLVLFPPMAPTLEQLGAAIEQHGITTLWLTAGLFHQMVDWQLAALGQVRQLLAGGDVLSVAHVNRALRELPRCTLINGYGPTENTTFTCCYVMAYGDQIVGSTPIGSPIANTRVYVLDHFMQPVPVGVHGELYIGGDGLARDYHRRPDLTAARFVPDPFSQIGGARLYRTGDLARYRSDGNIEFVGRIDGQVKLRGFRIELGEIETVLTQHPAVREAVVVVREESSEKRLVAYVVEQQNKEPETRNSALATRNADLRAYLANYLPDYMVPSAFVFLDALPLTANGKIDRRALPAPDFEHLKQTYVAPRTPDEETLAAIWAQVLKIERLGVHDNFFELGGHSLLATQVVARIRDAFKVEMPLHTLFESATVAGLAEQVARLQADKAGEADASGGARPDTAPLAPIGSQRREGVQLPLSFAQQRLWFLDRFEPGSPAYNICRSLIMHGSLDVAALHGSLKTIVERHAVLRTTFVEHAGPPVQVIAPTLELPLPLVDLHPEGTRLPAETRLAEARRLAQAEARQPFDLARGPLLRARLLRLAPTEHVLLLTMHHIVTDGWSMGVLFDELATGYAAARSGERAELPDLPIQYADFAAWQRQWLQDDALQAQLGYWREQLTGAPPVLELPTDRPRPAIQTSSGALQSHVLPRDLADALAALSRREGTTLFMTLLAAFDVLLHRYSGHDDIVVGSPIAGRTRAETERLIGCFVNTLALRTDLSGHPTFRALLHRVREVCLQAYAHQELPFERLVEELQPDRHPSHTPIFQVLFILQNERYAPRDLPGLRLRMITEDTGAAAFDLAISLEEQPDGLSAVVQYNTNLFDAPTIARLLDHFHTLLAGIVADPDLPIARLPLLSEAERQQMLYDWNATAAPYSRERCIHELIAECAMRTPEAVAVECGDQRLTYQELERRSNQLAHHLRALGVGGCPQGETPVALCLPRSLDMAVALLGTLKAGGCYLPLDPSYPAERLRFMLADSQAAVLVTHRSLAATLYAENTHSARLVCLDADQAAISQEPDTPVDAAIFAEHPAYLIYTSGSTGRPKGVQIPHRAIVARSRAAVEHYALQPADRVLQFAALSFDVAAEEIFPTWLCGATLVFWPQPSLAAPHELQQFVAQARLTVLNLPTPYWHAWIDELTRTPELLPHLEGTRLRLVVVGSDQTAPEWLARWRQLVGPSVGWYNAYGPTEATITSTLYSADDDSYLTRGCVPIGRPIANTQLYVLDRLMQPVPIGVVGELHIGGIGLARGYLGRPDATAERFIPDPFAREHGSRLYRTGDLARYRSDGNIEFLGRIDQQVKIRGFRIELGEIEAVLRQHPAVREAVVVACEERGEKRLVAYVVEQQNKEQRNKEASDSCSLFSVLCSPQELREFLRQRLPEYMVPSVFMVLDALPLTASGKIDRKALPAPDLARLDRDTAFVPPRNAVEQVLADIWADTLDLEQVGVHDNFFASGGHSLLAAQVIAQVREDFQVDLPLRCMFETPTVAGLAETLLRDPDHGASVEKIARLLVELADLSEEEVDIMLDAESVVTDEDHAR